MQTSSIEHASGHTDSRTRSAWQLRAIAILVAIGTNVVILISGRLLSGEYPTAKVGSSEQIIGFAQVIMVTGLVGLAAWGLLGLLERATKRARAIWTVIAVSVLMLSLLGPLGS